MQLNRKGKDLTIKHQYQALDCATVAVWLAQRSQSYAATTRPYLRRRPPPRSTVHTPAGHRFHTLLIVTVDKSNTLGREGSL
jgi:hypothetical protein